MSRTLRPYIPIAAIVTHSPKLSKTKNIRPLEFSAADLKNVSTVVLSTSNEHCLLSPLHGGFCLLSKSHHLSTKLKLATTASFKLTTHKSSSYYTTDGSGINGKIGAAVVIPSQNITFKAYLGPAHFFTVYSGELQGIAIALNSTSSASNQLIRRVTIFTGNRSAIQAVSAPSAQSGQQILGFIVGAIDQLQEQQIEVQIPWIPFVEPPIQGTWRSNDYVNAVRLVDMVLDSME